MRPVFLPPLQRRVGEDFSILEYDPKLKPLARSLRSGMTDAESKLWQRLRRKQLCGVQFYRQKPIGPYIVDFYAPKATLVVEVDGSQHYRPTGRIADRIRDDFLKRQGLRVLRFDDVQVLKEPDSVVEMTYRMIPGYMATPNEVRNI